MMREIIFRAWDGKNYSIGKPEYFDDSVNFRFHHFDIDCEKPVLEQYTGLKDKNGKMIFEGDIFSLGDKNILYVVEWCDTGLKGKQTRSTSWVGLEHWQDRIEIIGNIHNQKEDV